MEKSSRGISTPLVSFCIPCHNTERFVGETIECLLKQSYRNIEIVVIDDHSTDNSFSVIDSYKKVYHDRIVLEKSLKKGASAARNQAYNLSKGDFVVFFDSDDLVNPHYVSEQLSALKYSTDSVVISKWGRFYDNDLNTYKEDLFIVKRNLSFHQWVLEHWTDVSHTTPPGRLLIPRKIIEVSGGWNEDLSLNDDFEFFTRIFCNSKNIIYNNDSTFYYRSGIGGLSSKKSDKAYFSYFQSIKISIEKTKETLGEENALRRAYANIWKMFIYEVYPRLPELTIIAENEIKQLGGATIKFPAGRKTKALVALLGWKVVKKIKTR
ncbi:glycosyltransferase family 2 protein [Desertivirga arenae]|uniref:glycosyltransferase family 2 protein n=1 Tax=Desertivirga arenae TaxID=2810309 RepID=UPI001A95BB80|nr:glycosyltransferase family 2 protein [Pedobacter sp. SYSU D00823]